MKWAALILWVITALGGFGLLGMWLQRGGLGQADQPGRRIRPPLIFTHLVSRRDRSRSLDRLSRK
jgi:hypothetical protein